MTTIKKKDASINKIKSKYILDTIFEHIRKDKILLIIKYCKNIQKRLGIKKKIFKMFDNIRLIITPEAITDGVNNIIKFKKQHPLIHFFINNYSNEIENNNLKY